MAINMGKVKPMTIVKGKQTIKIKLMNQEIEQSVSKIPGTNNS